MINNTFNLPVKVPSPNPISSENSLGEALIDIRNNAANLRYIASLLDNNTQQLTKTISDIGLPNKVIKTNIVAPLIGGFFSYSNGSWSAGSNWFNYSILTKGNTRFVLNHQLTGQIRVIFKGVGDVFLGYGMITTNLPFNVASNVVTIKFNIKKDDSVPSSSLMSFNDTSSFKINSLETSAVTVKLVDEYLQDMKPKKVMKILAIGNSFADDTFEHFYEVARSAGIEVIVGVMYIGSGSLSEHWNKVQTSGVYEFRKWNKELGKVNTLDVTIPTAVASEAWDIIVLNQYSGDSGVYSTFQPFLGDLQTYIRGMATNPNMKFALNMTWSYATTSPHTSFPVYGSNTLTMYNAIINAYQQAVMGSQIDIVIPTGTAIQNARSLSYLNATQMELTRDGHHLGLSLGRLIVCYTAFAVLTKVFYGTDLSDRVDFKYISSASLISFGKIASRNAVMSPYKITSI